MLDIFSAVKLRGTYNAKKRKFENSNREEGLLGSNVRCIGVELYMRTQAQNKKWMLRSIHGIYHACKLY